jgi:chaperonin GroES
VSEIVPLGDRVVLQLSDGLRVLKSGLIIPDNAVERPQEGTVIAVGPGRFTDQGVRVPIEVERGDIVLFSRYGGVELQKGEDEFLVISTQDILARVGSVVTTSESPPVVLCGASKTHPGAGDLLCRRSPHSPALLHRDALTDDSDVVWRDGDDALNIVDPNDETPGG